MPICKRANFEGVQSKNKNETFNDNEEVFFCEVTKEIFRDYEDYFRHVMVINSTVWQCEATGRENLTYAEALKSEKRARKKMELFKESLRAPTMLVIESAKQSSTKNLNTLVTKFLRKRYFFKEIVTVVGRAATQEYKVVDILLANGKQPDSSVVYEETETLSYKLQPVKDSDKEIIVVAFPNIRRQRAEFTTDSLIMFIKHNIIREQGILKPKPEAYKKYVTDHGVTFQSLFIGKMPHYTPAKTKPVKAAKATSDEKASKASAKSKQSTMNKYLVKKGAEDGKNVVAKAPKISAEQREKERAEKAEMKAKSLREEMERVRQAKLEKLAALERERLEKRAELAKKLEADCDALLNKTDDLERNDQRLLPVYQPVRTFVATELVPDAFMIREFMHTYRNLLSNIQAIGRDNLNFYEMSRAFTVHEVGGPLTDILLILMGTIFDLQHEEESECAVSYERIWGERRLVEPYKSQTLATLTHYYSKRFYAFHINELPIDAHTLTEVLRLHLLSSGASVADRAEKWRVMYRNGYSSMEDPGLHFCMHNPHILRALSSYTIYQLEFADIISIIKCLMAQILTYSASVNLLEERLEQQVKLKTEIKNLMLTENRRLANVQTQRRAMTLAYNMECLDLKPADGNVEERKRQLEDKLNKKVADLLAQSERDQRKYAQQMEKLNAKLFDYLVFLGMDRAYRKYYVLESLPGIFVEHLEDSMDVCLPEPPKNVCMPNGGIQFEPSIPRNRKDLRIFLLKRYRDEEKAATTNTTQTEIQPKLEKSKTEVSVDNKENQANFLVNNGLTNGDTAESIKKESSAESNDVKPHVVEAAPPSPQPPKLEQPTQTELYMCSGEPTNCIVHSRKHPAKHAWSYLHERADIEALIESLNPLGERESKLRECLTTLHDLILQHVRKCPTYLLSVDEKTPKNFVLNETSKKYNRTTANYGKQIDGDINEIMRFALIERVLEFETDIYSGDLGRLKVKNMDKWREDVLNGKYEAQTTLQWGFMSVEQTNGGASTNGGDGDNNEDGDKNSVVSNEEDNETTRMVNGFRPGEHMKELIQSLANEDNENNAKAFDYFSEERVLVLRTHATWIRQLASALLQVEQAIERRFLKQPFGLPLKETKDKDQQKKLQQEANERIKRWEVSLMNSSSYAQVFMHLNILHDNVVWSRSTNKSNCMICRRGTEPDKMLLCDECNGGTHMFCMKPKMKTVPAGNWYCQRCIKRLELKVGADGVAKVPEKTSRLAKRKFIVDDDNSSETSEPTGAKNGRPSRLRGGSKRSLQTNEIEEALNEDQDDDDDNEDADIDAAEDSDIENVDDDDEAAAENTDEDDEEAVDGSENGAEKMQNGTAANSDEEDDNDETVDEDAEDDDEPVCKVCSYDGSELICSKCKSGFHLECVNLRRPPRYIFLCQSCRSKDQNNKKRKIEDSSENDDDADDNTNDDEDDDEDTEDQEISQPLSKRSRPTRSTSLRRSGIQNGSANEQNTRSEATASGGKSRRSLRRTGDDLPLNSSAIYKLLDEIMKTDSAWPFIRPVSLSEVPDYYKIIKNPMDLAKVKSKLNMGEYRINEEVMNDINLVFKNCDKYNEAGNEIYTAGKTLEKRVIKLCKDLHLPYKVSDLNK